MDCNGHHIRGPSATFDFASECVRSGTTAIFGYQVSSKKTRQPVRRIALWGAAVVSTIVAFFASAGFGIPVLEDFRNPRVEFREALIGSSIVWPICLGAWFVAVRCLIAALRPDAPPPNHS